MNWEIYKKYFTWCFYNSPEMFLDLFSASIPFIFSLFFAKSLSGRYLPLFFYSISIFFFEIINNHFAAYKKNNHDIYLGFYCLETFFLIWYFSSEITKKWYRITFTILGILSIIALIYNIFSETNRMNDFASAFQAMVFILIGVWNYYYILVKSNYKSLFASPFFWVNTGVFIYFSGKLFVSLYIFEMMSPNISIVLWNLWQIVPIALLIERTFLAIAIKKTKMILN